MYSSQMWHQRLLALECPTNIPKYDLVSVNSSSLYPYFLGEVHPKPSECHVNFFSVNLISFRLEICVTTSVKPFTFKHLAQFVLITHYEFRV